MKNDNRVLSKKSTSSDEWETPQDLFNKLNDQYHFTLDLCATDQNHKCNQYFTKQQDGLKQDWPGVCWCNPPYSNISAWVKKAYNEAQKGSTIVMLIPARTDTRWFHEWIYEMYGVEVEFLKGRLKFSGSKWNAPFPSMIVTFKKNPFL
jgi:site-specific DNA-methyltransferase (adenine-specific)